MLTPYRNKPLPEKEKILTMRLFLKIVTVTTVPEVNRLSQVRSTINNKRCVYMLYLPLEVLLSTNGHSTKLLFYVELPVCGNLVRASQIPSSSYDCSVESEDLVL